jgi:hypothetical protein
MRDCAVNRCQVFEGKTAVSSTARFLSLWDVRYTQNDTRVARKLVVNLSGASVRTWRGSASY